MLTWVRNKLERKGTIQRTMKFLIGFLTWINKRSLRCWDGRCQLGFETGRAYRRLRWTQCVDYDWCTNPIAVVLCLVPLLSHIEEQMRNILGRRQKSESATTCLSHPSESLFRIRVILLVYRTTWTPNLRCAIWYSTAKISVPCSPHTLSLSTELCQLTTGVVQ